MTLTDNERRAMLATMATILARITRGTATDFDRQHYDKIEAVLMEEDA